MSTASEYDIAAVGQVPPYFQTNGQFRLTFASPVLAVIQPPVSFTKLFPVPVPVPASLQHWTSCSISSGEQKSGSGCAVPTVQVGVPAAKISVASSPPPHVTS